MSESKNAVDDPKDVPATGTRRSRRAAPIKDAPAPVSGDSVDGAACGDLEAEQAVPAKRGRRKKSDLKQRAILEAAAKVFKSKGYARATLSEIGKKAGTFAGSMYYHFASKEELVEEVLNQGTTRVAEVVAQAVADLPDGSSHRTKIKAAFRAHLNQMLLRDDFIVAYWRIIDQVPTSVRARHLKKPRDYGDFWRTLIAEAVNAGEIRSDVQKTILRLVLVGSSIYALDWYSPRGEMDPDDIADAVIDILFDGVAPAHSRESA